MIKFNIKKLITKVISFVKTTPLYILIISNMLKNNVLMKILVNGFFIKKNSHRSANT